MNKPLAMTRDLPKTGELLGASDYLTLALETLITRVTLKKGAVLFTQGDDGDALFVVESGTIEISVVSTDGRKLSLAIMKPGDLLGEIALFDHGVRTASATALEDAVLRRVGRADVFSAIERDPRLGIDIIKLVGKRLRDVSTQLHEQVFLSVRARLARKLLNLTASGTDDPQASRTLKMSQRELAEFVNASREAVSKLLNQWRREELIDVRRGSIIIENRSALRQQAGLDLF